MTDSIIVNISYSIKYSLSSGNHMLIHIGLVNINVSNDYFNDRSFVFDTGAAYTVLSKLDFIKLGYRKCDIVGKSAIGGFGQYPFKCVKYRIPMIKIVNNLILRDPVVVVPDDAAFKINLLGQDILKKYNYYVDSRNQCIYFDVNFRQ